MATATASLPATPSFHRRSTLPATSRISRSSDYSPPLPAQPRPRPQPHRHVPSESLLAAMMHHSAPRAVLHATPFRLATRALELLFALIALTSLSLLIALHTSHVSPASRGCAASLVSSDRASPPTYEAGLVTLSINSSSEAPASAARLEAPRADSTFRFAKERGLLLLSPGALQSYGVSQEFITLPADAPCLGLPPVRAFLAHVHGYHTVAANAFAHGAPAGFVHAAPSGPLINLRHAATAASARDAAWARRAARAGALMTALFILCTTAALVNFTFKEVQVRIVKLTLDLQHAMREPAPGYARLLLQYATDALVFVPIVAGILFFLFEFFDDQLLAFAVLVIAWLAEIAVSGSTRHWVSRVYLPRLFFLYFGGFHFYFFSFPLGFSWMAFGTAIFFMFHACLAVWNRFEIPFMQRIEDGERPVQLQ